MTRLVLLAALLAAAVSTVGAPRADDAASTYSARVTIANQTIGLTAETDAANAQVQKVEFRVFLAPGECAEMQVVAKSAPRVAVADCTEQANLDKGAIQVGVKVVTVDRRLRECVVLGVRPLTGGSYTFEQLRAFGGTNAWVSATYIKN